MVYLHNIRIYIHAYVHTYVATVFPRLIPHPQLVPQCGTIQIQTTLKW